jgi:hypothetical protein
MSTTKWVTTLFSIHVCDLLKDPPEGKQATEILVIHIYGSVRCDVWGKKWAITAIQTIAKLCLPVKHMCLSIEPVYKSKLSDVMASTKDCHKIWRCTIFL